jgi:hypothetical protein
MPDGFSESWFISTKNLNLINNLWTKEALKSFGYSIFEAKLTPLNKVWPDIPKYNEFRPITIVSSVVKWLEMRFVPTIKNYLKFELDKK